MLHITYFVTTVTKSSMNPDTTLKKKHISIAFHQARETVAAGIALIFYETSSTNHANPFTKVMNHDDKKAHHRIHLWKISKILVLCHSC